MLYELPFMLPLWCGVICHLENRIEWNGIEWNVQCVGYERWWNGLQENEMSVPDEPLWEIKSDPH